MTKRRLNWLEVSADYRCNNRCVGCFSLSDDAASMTGRELLEVMQRARQQGAERFWLGGGEPTLRKDLLGVIRAAARLGYQTIKLQTNGMLLAYPEFADKLFDAGVNEVNFSIKGARAETHDRLTQTPGCYELMLRAIEHCRARGIRQEGDLLIYNSNMAELPSMVEHFTALGVRRYNIWLFTAGGPAAGGASLDREVPRISDLMPHLQAAMDLGLSSDKDFITSLHTPPCTVNEAYARCRFHARDLDLLVANPGGFSFWLEESPIEGGVYFERCAGCALRTACGGARADYIRLYGDQEFQPVPPAA